MNSFLCKWLVLYPVHYLRGEKIIQNVKLVDEVALLDEKNLSEYQRSQLVKVLTVAFQQQVYQFKLKYNVLTSNNVMDLLSSLPSMNKAKVRNIHGRLGAPGRTMDYRSTSGSTGEPLRFYKGRLSTGIMDAVQYAANHLHGISVGERQARFWGVPTDAKGRRLAKLKDFVKNRKRFSAFELDDASKKEFFDQIELFRPTYIYGYPSLICDFAKYMKKEQLSFSFPLKAVIGTGEHTFRHQIEEIEGVFDARYLNEYGCTEVGVIAFSCNSGSMHVMAQNIYLEIIKNGESVYDEEGEIYITELHSDYLPFIRYNIGDRGIIHTEKCLCGSHFPVIEIVAGRVDSYIITPSGKRIYDAILAYTLTEGVAKFKGFQRKVDELYIAIVLAGEFDASLFNKYRRDLNKAIGDDVEIIFDFVTEIPKDHSGKQRYFVSEIDKNKL